MDNNYTNEAVKRYKAEFEVEGAEGVPLGFHTDLNTGRLVFDKVMGGMEFVLPRTRDDLVSIMPDKKVTDFPSDFDIHSHEILESLQDKMLLGDISQGNFGFYYLSAISLYLNDPDKNSAIVTLACRFQTYGCSIHSLSCNKESKCRISGVNVSIDKIKEYAATVVRDHGSTNSGVLANRALNRMFDNLMRL